MQQGILYHSQRTGRWKRICRFGLYSEKQFAEKPALVVELKWDQSAEGAIKQIKDKKYFESLEEYQDNLLLIGINYDKKTKEHVCKIEKY